MEIFGVAALGALFQELMHWYSKRYEILEKGLNNTKVGWWLYLLIVLTMILASSAGTYIWFEERTNVPLKDVMIIGAAFPALLKLAVKGAGTSGSNTQLGTNGTLRAAIKSYFS